MVSRNTGIRSATSIDGAVRDIDLRVEHLMDVFDGFTDGLRMLMLMQRAKDGGAQDDDDKRAFATAFTYNTSEFRVKLREFLLLQYLYPRSRIYSSVNARVLRKVTRIIERDLLDSHYQEEVAACNMRKKIIARPRHWVMQPSCAETSYFLIDVDSVPGKDMCGEALKEAANIGVDILLTYPTKNGWHIITKPFNPNLWTHTSNIKKDGMLLLSY